MANTLETDRILFVGTAGGEGRFLGRLLRGSKWQLHGVSNNKDALEFLGQHLVPVVLCEPKLPDGNWRELLNSMAMLSATPNLIVSSRLADNCLWAEVLNLGGFDVLMTPFEMEEVLRVTLAARLNWGCRNSEKTAGESRAGQAGIPDACGGTAACPEPRQGARQMFDTRLTGTIEFKEGDNVVLAEGTYQGTPGVFIRLRQDVNWADIMERNGTVRCHPVAWMKHSDPPGNTAP